MCKEEKCVGLGVAFLASNSVGVGGDILFFGVDPVGVGVSVSVGVSVDVGVTLSCLHDISLTGGWIITKFAWM